MSEPIEKEEPKVTEDYYNNIVTSARPNNPNYVEYDPLVHGWRGEEPRRNWVPPVTSPPKRVAHVVPLPPIHEEEEEEEGDAEEQLLDEATPSPRRTNKFFTCFQCFGSK